jgi:outer membrane protein TolC
MFVTQPQPTQSTRKLPQAGWLVLFLFAYVLTAFATPALAKEHSSVRRISLQEALQMLLKRNPELAREKLTIRQAQAGIGMAKGAFRFDLNVDLRLDRSLLPAGLQVDPSLLTSTTQHLALEKLRMGGNIALTKQFELGTQLTLEFQQWWNKQDRFLVSKIVDQSADPVLGMQQANNSLTLRIAQPLLRGAWFDVNTAPIKQAQERVKAAKQKTSWFVVQQVAQASLAYWDLVYARRQMEIAENALILAKRQHKDTLTLIQAGKLPKLERYQVEQVVATRQNDIIKAQRSIDAAETALAKLLNLPESAGLYPTDSPKEISQTPALKKLLAWAKANHPSMKAAQSQLNIAKLATIVSKNQLLHQLDVVGSFSLVGFGRTDDNDKNGSSLGGAYGTLFNPSSHSFYVGLSLNIPLDNRTAQERARIDQLEVERNKLAIASLKRQMTLNIKQMHRDINRTSQQIKTTQASLSWAKKKLEAEKLKWKSGKSTLFQVLQFQHDLAAAQLASLRAHIDQRRARIALYAQVGSLPQIYGIQKRR